MRKAPKISKLFLNDYFVFTGFFTLILSSGIGIYLRFGEVQLVTSIIFICLAVSALVLIIARYFYVAKLFSNGTVVEATIGKVSFYRSRATLRFTYEFESVSFNTYNLLLRNSKTVKMRPETKVSVLVNPLKPKQALILDVYQ